MPRNHTETEIEVCKLQKAELGKLGDGIYTGHSYALIAAETFVNSEGREETLFKLRNPFFGEKWEGDWSYESKKWTEK